MIEPSGLTVVVPWVGPAVTATDAGFNGEPPADTVSLPRTVVVTGVFCAVVAVSGFAVTVLLTVTVTTAGLQTGVGVEVSHTV